MAKFITAREAAALIPDGATVGLAGMGLSGWAEELACAIRDNFRETGHPCNLNLKQGSAMGDWGYGNQFDGWERSRLPEPDNDHGVRGVSRFGEAGPGLVTKWTSAHIGSAFAMCDLARKEQVESYCLPQGVIINLWREIAAGRPGLITKTGLGTFVDPRVEGGRMNACAKDELVKLVEFNGEEYLFYPSFKADVALLRGTIADENGNISFAHESVINEGFSVATAVKNSGGIVIVQVEYVAKKETLNPKDIKIPGVLVDYVVVAKDPKSCWQAEGTYWEPSYSGHIRIPLDSIEPLPFDERKVICRRVAMELKKGDLVNLGVGMPADVAKVVAEEGFINDVVMSTESGMVGGVPSALPSFGSAYNPEAIITQNEMFDLISGGGLSLTCLGIGEADGDGNNNVSRMGKRLTGPGGFIDITRATPKVIFAGTLMGKAKLKVGDGKLEIVEEGTIQKFVEKVGQITFAGQYTPEDQEVLYVTERAVFRLIDHKMTLVEIAPGIDLQKDVLDRIGFEPVISPELKTMDEGIFHEKWGGLGAYIDK
ncbi:MAG: acyl CoA:acetate/3-ketoacid CoA transferase [Oscillospiraceae bacterium]|nr:acyl CoA:acetate/3-ketoacid CoA transferase [Oscillospiraceae bacterium]